MKKGIRILAVSLILLTCLGIFTACIDYGYEYHFSVVGGKGSVSAEWTGGDISPVLSMGGKKGDYMDFTAIPDEGYQVKEWTLNGQIVEGNKTNSFTAIVTQYVNYITVEFEPIP